MVIFRTTACQIYLAYMPQYIFLIERIMNGKTNSMEHSFEFMDLAR